MKIKHPKILIINQQSILTNNATGITLQSLLKSWPSDKLMEIHILPEDKKQFSEFKKLKSVRVPKITFPLWSLANISILKKANKNLTKTNKTKTNKTKQKPKNPKTQILRQCLYAVADSSFMYINSNLKKQVDDFKPDVIYTLGSNVSSMKLALYFSKRFDLNIVMHFMDNWQETLQWEDNRFLKPYKFILDILLKKIYKRSTKALAISPKMAEEYTKRWNVDHNILMNSVDIGSMFCEDKKKSDSFSFVYAGGLHLERWKSLKGISQAIEIVSTELQKEIILKIYTGKENKENYKKYFNYNFVKFNDYVPHENIKSVFNEADVLLHTEVDNPQLYGFFKHSISTKIPEYLASNRPMLFYGPQKLYLYQYLRDEGVAYTVSDKNELVKAIKELVQNKEMKEKMLKNSRILAIKNHDRNKGNQVFYDSIVGSIK